MPEDRGARILVISCGPGYLVNLLKDKGYRNVAGIDWTPPRWRRPASTASTAASSAPSRSWRSHPQAFDAIVGEQELNHLTDDEMIAFLKLCRSSLEPGGRLVVYGFNGANRWWAPRTSPITSTTSAPLPSTASTEVLELAGFEQIQILPLKLYVFWKNPLNYVGLVVTGFLELCLRIIFKMYGKNVTILTKKIAASCRKPA